MMSDWVCTLALWAFPATSRDRYGRDMAQLLEDHCRAAGDEGRSAWRIWLMGLGDILVQGFGERMEIRRHRRTPPRRPKDAMMLDVLGQDLRFAIRQIRKNRTFAAVAIATLALGIGANTAVFSVINGVIRRPLPYPAPQDRVRVWTRFLPESGYEGEEFSLSPREGVAYGDATKAMEHVAIYDVTSTAFTGDGNNPTRLSGLLVDEGFFPLLRLRPNLGRWFTPDELAPNGPRAAWREEYGHPQAGHALYLANLHDATVGSVADTLWMLMGTGRATSRGARRNLGVVRVIASHHRTTQPTRLQHRGSPAPTQWRTHA